MREHLRFASCYWHTMRNTLADPFGVGTALMPWEDGSNTLDNAERRAHVFFELLQKLGMEFWCFHDDDVSKRSQLVNVAFVGNVGHGNATAVSTNQSPNQA